MNKSLSLRTYEAFHSFMYHLRTNPLVLIVGVFAIAFEFVAWFSSGVVNFLVATVKFIGSLNWVDDEHTSYYYADSMSDFDDVR
jgi:hypothetical protein